MNHIESSNSSHLSKNFLVDTSSATGKKEFNDFASKFLEIENDLAWKLMSPSFGFMFNPPVKYVYNPLEYAHEVHYNFVSTYCDGPKDLLFLGMNPGPWGMMQTGVPFGEVSSVRDWLKLSGNISEPVRQHPHKKVQGFACKRSEVSGTRFWSLAQNLSNHNPFIFFKNSFLYNYFPLVLLSDSGKNITPADLKSADQKLLQNICDESLLKVIQLLDSKIVVAIGRFAEKKATTLLKDYKVANVRVVYIPHPSPRNPSSNKNWLGNTLKQIYDLDLAKYFS